MHELLLNLAVLFFFNAAVVAPLLLRDRAFKRAIDRIINVLILQQLSVGSLEARCTALETSVRNCEDRIRPFFPPPTASDRAASESERARTGTSDP